MESGRAISIVSPFRTTDGSASFANRDFGRELRVTYRKVVFSATADV
jgi:hypothetical protein